MNDPLEDAIRDLGEDWLLDDFVPREEALNHLHETLRRVADEAKSRDCEFSEEIVLAERERNPYRVRAFLQLLGGRRTPCILLMAWRVIQGMEVREVSLNYSGDSPRSFKLEVALLSPYGESAESYESTNIRDLAVLRHFGYFETDGEPRLDGIHPLKMR